MPNLLCIETSGDICSVALFKGNELLWESIEEKERSHAQKLPLMIRDGLAFLRSNEWEPDAIGLSAGPGSYTGLRIGCSLAKGLCLGLGIPLVSVSALKIMWNVLMSNGKQESEFFIPMIDARRMDVYYSVFDQQGQVLEQDSALILDGTSFESLRKKGSCIFFGSGSKKFEGVVDVSGKERFDEQIGPVANVMGDDVLEKYLAGDVEDLAYFEPKYVKDVFVTDPKPIFKG